jgi:hypothetical protein
MPLGQAIISVNSIGQPMPARYAESLHRGATSADVRVRSCRCSPTSPKATGLQFTPDLITEVGEVTAKSTEQFLRDFMEAFEVFVTRVLTVLPPERFSTAAS